MIPELVDEKRSLVYFTVCTTASEGSILMFAVFINSIYRIWWDIFTTKKQHIVIFCL